MKNTKSFRTFFGCRVSVGSVKFRCTTIPFADSIKPCLGADMSVDPKVGSMIQRISQLNAVLDP